MDLLFFDIECASVSRTMAKICAFGFVLCDENFNVIEKRDILINPRGGFHLTDVKGEHGIVLPYKYSDFKKYPAFPAVYPEIKKMLEDKNNIVCGHATLNDVKYLALETRRFKLPSFNFRFYDSQLTYMTMTDDFTRQFGLESITKDLNVDFTPHRAADDAYATMRVAEAMCKKYGCGFMELHQKLNITAGYINKGGITRPKSAGQARFAERHAQEKQERSKNRVKFYEYLSRKHRTKGGAFAGKVFNFSRLIEDDLEKSLPLLDLIYANGGTYVQKVAKANAFVREDGDKSERVKQAEKAALETYTPDQLKEMAS